MTSSSDASKGTFKAAALQATALLFGLFIAGVAHGADLRLAVAANFRSTLELVTEAFKETHTISIDISSASTGALYAQIKSGAPFDILFAADSDRPARLESEGLTRHRQTYAFGQLVFWKPDHAVSATSLAAYHGVLAVANPRHAPYGQAAMDVLSEMNLAPQLVYGSNVAQAFNFVLTRNAPAGLVALAQIRVTRVPVTEYWIVPEQLHRPIEQQLVVLKNADPAAEQFVAHLATPEIVGLISAAGYRAPVHPR